MTAAQFRFTVITALKCQYDQVPCGRGAGVPPTPKCHTPASLWCPECELHFCAAHGGNHGHAGPEPMSRAELVEALNHATEALSERSPHEPQPPIPAEPVERFEPADGDAA